MKKTKRIRLGVEGKDKEDQDAARKVKVKKEDGKLDIPVEIFFKIICRALQVQRKTP